MECLNSGDLNGLYRYILDGGEIENLELDKKFINRHMPNPYFVVEDVKRFISNGGDTLWKLLKERDDFNIKFNMLVERWLDEGGDINIRHPVTGNYIPHENMSMFLSLSKKHRLKFKHNLTFATNFDGDEAGVLYKQDKRPRLELNSDNFVETFF